MNTQDIEQMNETIAAFEGRKKTHLNEAGKVKVYWSDPSGINPLYSDALYYHVSWDELMPVVEKIESMHLSVRVDGKCTEIMSRGVDDESYPWLSNFEYIYEESDCRISAAYNAVMQFIAWYNENVKNHSGN